MACRCIGELLDGMKEWGWRGGGKWDSMKMQESVWHGDADNWAGMKAQGLGWHEENWTGMMAQEFGWYSDAGNWHDMNMKFSG
ncbi:hypothetical protein BaRGS_00039630 [Batillaria attramentaria]|uniref:Uncharacterized protein n=1 Tax=Batillaria attramentaria TaxID=370345 RepID=A0ABD0J2L0_9CAEN